MGHPDGTKNVCLIFCNILAAATREPLLDEDSENDFNLSFLIIQMKPSEIFSFSGPPHTEKII